MTSEMSKKKYKSIKQWKRENPNLVDESFPYKPMKIEDMDLYDNCCACIDNLKIAKERDADLIVRQVQSWEFHINGLLYKRKS